MERATTKGSVASVFATGLQLQASFLSATHDHSIHECRSSITSFRLHAAPESVGEYNGTKSDCVALNEPMRKMHVHRASTKHQTQM